MLQIAPVTIIQKLTLCALILGGYDQDDAARMRRPEVFWMLPHAPSFPHDKLDTSRLGLPWRAVSFADLFLGRSAMWALMWYIRLPESSVLLSTASTNRVLRVQLLEVPHAQVVEMTMSPLTTI